MTRFTLIVLAALALSACSGDGTNPFDADDTTDTTDGSGTDGGTDTNDGTGGIVSGSLHPGTTSPSAATGIYRSEPKVESQDDKHYGNGFANSISYNGTNDTFYVDGLAFDGNQPDGAPYTRGSAVSSLRSYALYEGPTTNPDFLTNQPIAQFQHRALYGVSSSGDTQFAIIRTGNYVGYGFGGFIYQRAGSVVLPTQGQASYSGDYAGIRDFDGRGGLEYVTGDMQVDIDFCGFQNNCSGSTCADAIRGYVTNRTLFDTNGTDVTNTYLDALNEDRPDGSAELTGMPVIRFRIGPNVLSTNGEATGSAFTTAFGESLDDGNYYPLLSGDQTTAPGGEIVGIVVVESDDPRYDNVTVRETGGFVVTR